MGRVDHRGRDAMTTFTPNGFTVTRAAGRLGCHHRDARPRRRTGAGVVPLRTPAARAARRGAGSATTPTPSPPSPADCSAPVTGGSPPYRYLGPPGPRLAGPPGARPGPPRHRYRTPGLARRSRLAGSRHDARRLRGGVRGPPPARPGCAPRDVGRPAQRPLPRRGCSRLPLPSGR